MDRDQNLHIFLPRLTVQAISENCVDPVAETNTGYIPHPHAVRLHGYSTGMLRTRAGVCVILWNFHELGSFFFSESLPASPVTGFAAAGVSPQK